MSKIWVFGDSFSMDYNKDTGNVMKYVKWKGKHVNNFADFIGLDFNMSVKNFSVGGSDNFSIFENFCNCVNEIQKDDFIFIGWGARTRFRLIDNRIENNNIWFTVNGPLCYSHIKTFIDIDEKSYLNLLVNRDNKLNDLELHNWGKLIKKAHPNNFVHMWSWYDEYQHGHEKISEETNNLIDDFHWSENGHKSYSEIVMEKIKKWNETKNIF